MTKNIKQAKGYGIKFLLLLSVFFIQSCTQKIDKEKKNEAAQQWTRIGPGGGGGTFIPTFSYENEDNFFIRCDMTGAYHTKDGGNSYKQINYPNGSFSFAFDPLDSTTIYIGSRALNKSSDGGETWEKIFPFEEDIIEEVFSGDHADFNFITTEKSLYSKTSNQKETLPTHGKHSTVKNIKVDPNSSEVIYFSINNYFFYTKDGGRLWSKIAMESKIDFIYTNTTNAKETVHVFTHTAVYRINKQSWEVSAVDFPEGMQPAFSLTGGMIKERKKTVFYALHNDESLRVHGGIAPTTLWTSQDFGATWQESKNEVITNEKNTMPTYSMLAAAENDAANVYVVTSSYNKKKKDGKVAHWFGTFKSADAGKTWDWVWKGGGGSGKYGIKDGVDAQNLTDAWVNKAFGGDYIRLMDIGVAPNDGNIAIVTDWYRSMKTVDGGKTWTAIYSTEQSDGSYISNGLDVTTVYGIHFDPFDSTHIAISYTDIGYHHSYNGGKSWFRSVKGIPVEWENTCYWMVFDPKVKDKVWSVWSGLHDFPRGKMTRNPEWTKYGKGGVALSLDGGKSWTPTVDGMGFETPSVSIVLDENSPVNNRTLYVAAYGKGVYKSVDDGKTWKLHNKGIENSLAAFELTIQPDGTLFLITSPTPQHKNGKVGRDVFMGAIYKSIDGAESWQRLDVGEKTKFPNGLAFDPENPKKLYLGSWSDIYLSDMVGKAVTKVTGGNELIDLDGGILMSENGGDSWVRIFDKDKYVYDVTVDTLHLGRIYCNTFNGGAYRSDDYGKTWKKIKDYDFHWGHRVIVDKHNSEKVYLTTYGSSVWHGKPEVE